MIAGELLLLPVLQACSEELQVVLDCKDGAGAAALVITGMHFAAQVTCAILPIIWGSDAAARLSEHSAHFPLQV